MANKFTYEINLDTKGYSDGVKDAKDSNADFTSSIKRVKDNLPNLKKELNSARKEAMGLALSYSKLSDAEKKSGFGRALARELEEAKQRTAELVDMTSDLQTEFRNLASDTATWDAIKDGIGIARDAATGFIGTIASLTGKEKELQPLIAKIAQVQGLANAAIGIGNALQKQSNVMLGIAKIQKVALAKATALEASATKGATIAQRAFNAVAKANPYVLLAAAIIGVVGAIGTFIAFSKKESQEEIDRKKHLKELADQHRANAKTINDSAASVTAKYIGLKTQWEQLQSTAQKTQWIKDNKTEFNNLGLGINNVTDAENAFVNMTPQVIAALQARAKATAAYNIMVETLEKQLKQQMNKSTKTGDYYVKATQSNVTDEEKRKAGINTKVTTISPTTGTAVTKERDLKTDELQLINDQRRNEALEKRNKILKENDKELKTITDTFTQLTKEAEDAEKKTNGLMSSNTKTNNSSKASKQTTDTVKPETESIAALEQEISDLQTKLKNGLIPKDDIKKTVDRISDLKKKVKTLNIEYGFESPEKAKTKLEELQDKLAKHQKAYVIAVDANDEQARQAAQEAYYAAQKELDNYKLSITIEAQADPEVIKQQRSEIQSIVNDALDFKVEPQYDFSLLPDFMQEYANQQLNQLKQVEDAQNRLKEILNDESSSDTQIASAQEGLDQLHEKWQQVTEDVNLYNEANKEISTTKKRMEALSDSVTQVGNAVSAAASLFSALGEAGEDNDMKAMGIVAQAIATIALSFAQALTTAKTWVDWLAFGISGLATMTTMITQVKSLTAGSYATGGVIPGSSYHGDKMMAYVNSGERVLTARQNESFESLIDMLDHNKLNSVGQPSNVYVTGKIQGKDLLLVQKNANSIMGKSGQNIHF